MMAALLSPLASVMNTWPKCCCAMSCTNRSMRCSSSLSKISSKSKRGFYLQRLVHAFELRQFQRNDKTTFAALGSPPSSGGGHLGESALHLDGCPWWCVAALGLGTSYCGTLAQSQETPGLIHRPVLPLQRPPQGTGSTFESSA